MSLYTEMSITRRYNRTKYNVEASSSGRLTGAQSNLSYLGGGIGGPIAEDVFHLGSEDVTVQQTFIDANQSSWADLPGDGFIGFGFNTIAENGTTTLMHTLLKSGLLEKPEFAIYYGNDGNNENSTGGVFTIGGNHEDKYVHGQVADIPMLKQNETGVNQYELWASQLFTLNVTRTKTEGSTFAGSNLVSLAGGERVVFDTGANFISVADFAIDSVYESIGWNYTEISTDKLVLPCSWFNSSWSVEFIFEGYQTVRLYGDQLAVPGYPAAPDSCWPPFENSGASFNLFGPVFLSRFYSVFDFGSFDEKDYKPHLRLGQLRDS